MALQVDHQALALRFEDPTADRAALLGMKAVSDGDLHDAVGPVRAGEARPGRLLVHAPHAPEQPLPNALAHLGPSLRCLRGQRVPSGAIPGATL